MSATGHYTALAARHQRLQQFLQADPDNLNLLADAASAALDAHHYDDCDALLARYAVLAEPTPALRNLAGLSAMSQSRFDLAEQVFASLSAEHDDAHLRFNLAYAIAMQERYAQALPLLDDAVLAEVAESIRLKMLCLYHLGELDAVIALGEQHADHPLAGEQICGLLATALFDADQFERAQHYAARAPESVGGLTVQGLLALQGDDLDRAQQSFERALETDPASGRAQLGEGLAYLSQNEFAKAAPRLDRAATLLRSHAGSWLSAGWAYLMDAKLGEARERFERSLQTDRGFAEATGALAVVDIYEGHDDQARHRADAALRLDPNCLAATYAKSLLLAKAGHSQQGAALYQQMVQRPLGEDGPSIAQLIARRASHGVRG
ncbi:MAG: tetratricopeptide repeat protein [Lysobacter sp.]